jgi:NAD-dependent DNA ligase
MSEALLRIFNRARLDDRQVNELLGICHALIADGSINESEVAYLQKWLVANTALTNNPVIQNLLHRVNHILLDRRLDDEEARDLFETLKWFSGGDFELGEVLKSTSLPLDVPQPAISFDRMRFCFTGTFAYGSRTKCEDAVINRGASAGSLMMKTNFLVVGIYATETWAHSSFGRKIERAVRMRDDDRVPIRTVGEEHWLKFVTA